MKRIIAIINPYKTMGYEFVMSASNFCSNCGSQLDHFAKFCKNCGASITVGSESTASYNSIPQPTNMPYQQYGPYSNPMYSAPHSIQFEPWKKKNIIKTTLELYKNPSKVGPSIILSDSSPDPTIFAVITGILAFIVGYIVKIKYIDPLVHNVTQDTSSGIQVESVINRLQWLILFFIAISPILSMYIGSAVVNLIMKGDFPIGSYESIKGFDIFKKIWGYLLFGNIIYELVMIPVILLITPQSVDLLTITITTFPKEIYLISIILQTIISIINLITFRRIAKSLNNNGNGLMAVLLIWGVLILYSVSHLSLI